MFTFVGGADMKALVRRPSPRLEEGCVVHIERSAIDFALAESQWHAYVQVLRDHEWQIVEVPRDDDSPDGVFVEDAVVMFGEHAIATRPGTPSRSAEPLTVEPVLRGLGATIHHITEPATLEGGDVLKVGSTIYVGLGARTNAAGIAQFRAIVEPLGASVVAVPVTRALHLKSAVTALPDGAIIGWPAVVDDPAMFPRYMAMPEEAGAHVVLLGGDRLMMSSAAPESAELLRSIGYDPVLVDVSEYEKLEGCVTCLSVRLRT